MRTTTHLPTQTLPLQKLQNHDASFLNISIHISRFAKTHAILVHLTLHRPLRGLLSPTICLTQIFYAHEPCGCISSYEWDKDFHKRNKDRDRPKQGLAVDDLIARV